ncbi:rhamnogalacturonate lyase a [Fusarium albosuccineum]|uniref:Rhamnogalacturonate lyase n=2 Tax=Fusarium decemcellulare species complex TaxID=1329916 RepID=A0A8H4KX62_9HYPO|nr:rhamnogalacturonate lyase a [Fusarium albosuccineum]
MVNCKYLGALLSASPALAAFGVTTSGTNLIVDSGNSNGFSISISTNDCSINSIKFRGEEFQYKSQTSHIASGLGSATVSNNIINSKYAKVTCTAKSGDFDLTHYYVVQNGQSIVYMATDTKSEPAIGELRYITRLDRSKLPDEYPFGDASNTSGGSAIEGSDVFLVNGQTRSKFYSSQRFIDNDVYCFRSSAADTHACMVAHPSRSYEKSSGGPFFRDINTNNNGDFSALTFYMNSNHAQTESYRQGFHGPYALSFSRSGVPKAKDFDFSFFSDLSISGFTADSARGRVSGTASGIQSGFQGVVHWYNANYQYWTYTSSGSFTSPFMVPGTYTMVLYQGELQVASKSVTVSAGSTASSSIAASSDITTGKHTSVFRIGDWDGQPTGFRNAANQLRMHPSDTRMSSWGPLTYTVGSSSVGDFPMALFKTVNNPVTIKFNLGSAISSSATLRIGTTLAFASGRPQVVVNGGFTKAFDAPTKVDSRGVTRGAYRGRGEVYDAVIPAGNLKAGSNTITIEVISGSSGDTYLNPNFIFDAVELFY